MGEKARGVKKSVLGGAEGREKSADWEGGGRGIKVRHVSNAHVVSPRQQWQPGEGADADKAHPQACRPA